MNNFIMAQIQNMTTVTQTFKQACRVAAVKDDGKIDKDEDRILKKIDAAADRFIKELQRIK